MARRLKAFVACFVARDGVSRHRCGAECVYRRRSRTPAARVLPGVTVEASSPVLIEGTKSPTVTDANGQYRITDLRPGVYTVTFSLPGFKQSRQEKVELRVDFVGTLNASLEVGALEEAITVTGTSPTVDVSSNAKVEVMTAEILEQVPTGRTHPGAWRSSSAASRSTCPTSAARARCSRPTCRRAASPRPTTSSRSTA